ncbi:hypothetical protein [Paenibacillus eucommiae]|uniref:Glycosyl hydrolase-like 10 domain-containing protein n=1 Tax=Paenibacillus eucommiae TaxID=1355755 RepID=A0ABS4IWV5_9BACL|nr:hypothetical protein [Paenibacillus eucommiae]MBP1992075.1 hypothetical protein [Paenibacillus eucommiae]
MNFEKWLWVELIGFDNEQENYGVPAYLDNLGFVPAALSLLFYSPDFVHLHDRSEKERVFPPEICSYTARPYGRDRARQEWTSTQLRGLLSELQQRGVEVYCSFFDLFIYKLDGKYYSSEWCSQHPELHVVTSSVKRTEMLNPLGRLADGTYYEDFFVKQLAAVMEDYGFDGYHGADGYTSPRISLAEADYSDDMVGQFTASGRAELPSELSGDCEGNAELLRARADWIWANKRFEWIDFYAERWETFWRKIAARLHPLEKKFVLNSTWTRDPFEAMYRFGVDYKRLANTGIDGFVIEAGAAALTLGAGGMEYEPCNEFKATLMLIKSYVPDTKLICLNTIQDTTERWDALRHAPAVLERDILTLPNVYRYDRQGQLERCSSGWMGCLADGIDRQEWKWINRRWELGFNGQPERLIGATFLWSDQMLATELHHYIETRDYSSHKWLHTLISLGAPVYAAANIENLELLTGPVFVTNAHLWPEDELQSVLAYTKGPVILIGKMTDRAASLGLSAAAAELNVESNESNESKRRDAYFMAIYPDGGSSKPEFLWEETGRDDAGNSAADSSTIDDAISWVQGLHFSAVTDTFLQECVAWIGNCSESPKVLEQSSKISVNAMEIDQNRWRLLIANGNLDYKSPKIDVGRSISQIKVCTDFPGTPVSPRGTYFNVTVPGRGTVILELDFDQE